MGGIRTRRVRAVDLQVGDEVLTRSDREIEVINRWRDVEGLWLETSDGDMGYVDANAHYRLIVN